MIWRQPYCFDAAARGFDRQELPKPPTELLDGSRSIVSDPIGLAPAAARKAGAVRALSDVFAITVV